MKKRLLSILLSLALLAALLPQTVGFAADDGACGSNLTWALENTGVLTITGTGPMTEYASFTDVPWYVMRNTITEVKISEGVTSICEAAFCDCVNLTKISIAESVTSIGSAAFAYCTGLRSITIPAGVTSIGASAFVGCSSLAAIYVAEGNSNYSSDSRGVLFNQNKTVLIQAPGAMTGAYEIPSGVTRAEVQAFESCGLSSVTIPASLECLSERMFCSCRSLTSVTISSGVTAIEDEAFYFCTSLTAVSISNSVTSIGSAAFGNCTSLERIVIPAAVTSIGSIPFGCCSSLREIYVAQDNPNYASGEQGELLNKDKTELIQVPGGVQGTYEVPDTVTEIGFHALDSCNGLTGLTIPDGVQTIRSGACIDCVNLTSVTIGVGVTSIESGAFGRCTGLTDVYYTGNQTQWDAMEIAAENEPLLEATRHYNQQAPQVWQPLIKTGSFAYESHFIDTTAYYTYSYDENWFLKDSTKYQHDLARMSIRMAMAAATTESTGIQALLESLQFEQIEASYPTPTTKTIGYAIGSKTIEDDGEACTLLAVAVRGGGYQEEWADNFRIGSGEEHTGFSNAASMVLQGVCDYISENHITGRLKIWVTGYSRAAATSNVLGYQLNVYGKSGQIRHLAMEDIFVYCFECPRTATDTERVADMTKNIFCIVNPVDAVPQVAPADWDYDRYGTTYYLPSAETTYQYASAQSKLIASYTKLLNATGTISTQSKAEEAVKTMTGQGGFLSELVSKLAWHLGGMKTGQRAAAQYSAAYQSEMMSVGKSFGGDAPLGETLGKALSVAPTFLVAHPVYLTKTVANASYLGAAHYPELCLAWLDAIGKDALSKNSTTEDGEETAGYVDGRTRIVRIGGAETVSVYDSDEVLVAQFDAGEVQQIEGSTIAAYLDEDGQLVIYLPCDEQFSVAVCAAQQSVSYQIAQVSLDEDVPERLVSYSDVAVQAGDVLRGNVENLSETQADYTLTDAAGMVLTPQADETAQTIRYCAVALSQEGEGTVTGGGRFAVGEAVQVVAEAADGMRFAGWYEEQTLVCSELVYRFTAEADRNLTARFEPIADENVPCDGGADCPGAAFSDMPAADDWAHAGIDYAVQNNLMNGFTDGTFLPGSTLTRAQMVMVLHRVQGAPTASASAGYSDVAAGQWYAAAVDWAAQSGVVTGYPDGTFLPGRAVSREQIATMLYRSQGEPEVDESVLDSFPDASSVHSYARKAMSWAVTQGLINGVGSGGVSYLRPTANATRAQFATIMMRYLEG